MAMQFDMKSFGNLDREQLVFMARTAESAERYDDMCQFMKTLVIKFVPSEKKAGETGTDLTVEERNLLSVAYKNVIGARRASWRTLGVEDARADEETQHSTQLYKSQVEKELEEICNDVLDLLTKRLLLVEKPKVTEKADEATYDESVVFYLKMTADYYRYLAEFKPNEGNEMKAAEHYEKAMVIAKDKLSPTHPIRLGLALNYSVCYYEILKKPEQACQLAKDAFDQAIKKLDALDDVSYKDSTLIMQLLRDNLTLWTQDNQEEQKDAPDEADASPAHK